MNKVITAISINSDMEDEDFSIELPSQCPHCSIAYSNLPLVAYYVDREDFMLNREIIIYTVYFCPHCELFFSVAYTVSMRSLSPNNYLKGYAIHTYPTPTSKLDFPSRLKALSPKFVEIYHQSEKAENDGLTEICGMGYRKALEFLVKDFAIYTRPDKRSEIESPKLMLNQCISDYIDSEKIKTMARASSWIGNDETHYTRKHEDYDIQDLKRFINTTAAFIEYELNFKEASNFLNPEQS